MTTAALRPQDVKALRQRSELTDSLGDRLGDLLMDPTVRDLEINEDGSVWLDRLTTKDGRRVPVEGLKISADESKRLAIALAMQMGEELNEEHDDAVGKLGLEEGKTIARVSLHAPPAVDQHTICIRKQDVEAKHPRELVTLGILDEVHYKGIYEGQREGLNTTIVGAQSSGKTYTLNGCLQIVAEVDPSRRYGYVDPIGETVCPLKNHYHVRPTRLKTERDRIRELMTRSLDSVTNAETKSGAAFDLIDSWNTHNGGHTSTHGTTVRSGVQRIETCYMMAGNGPAPKAYIASVAHLWIVIAYHRDVGRRITEVARIVGTDGDDYRIEYIGKRYELNLAERKYVEI